MARDPRQDPHPDDEIRIDTPRIKGTLKVVSPRDPAYRAGEITARNLVGFAIHFTLEGWRRDMVGATVISMGGE